MSAVRSLATACGLTVDDVVLLNNSNKLTVRLLPCDLLARVAPPADHVAQFEIDLAQRLAELSGPVARLDPRVEPRVYEHDGFVVTLWTWYEVSDRQAAPADYARALDQLHAGMRRLDVTVPHFVERVERAQQLLADPERTPELADSDREVLSHTLQSLTALIGERGSAEQVLHGEPHPGNVLATNAGLVFIDFETCCRGPIEFDLAHAPDAVEEHYPGIDRVLLQQCRMLVLVLAMITTWRWDRDDQFPNGRVLAAQWLSQLRAMRDR
jgi:aminoglycoside phosphotransferase (APT) family kinase protein